MEHTLEGIIRQHRAEIVRCIKEPTIVGYLESTLLTPDDAKRLRAECRQKPTEWVDNMLDIVQQSQAPGKHEAFFHGLEKSDYLYLVRLLRQEPVEKDEGFIKRIGLHLPTLVKSLHGDLSNILGQLISRRVLNNVDKQEIESHCKNKGSMHAVELLLDRMQCRLSPAQWYYRFCDALQAEKRDDVLKELDPDFLDPSTSLKSKGGCETDMEVCGEEPAAQAGSVTEHILTDTVEAEMPMNNLSEAGPQSPTLSYHEDGSLSSDKCEANRMTSSIEDNLRLLNIKPEMCKPLLHADPSLTGIKQEGGAVCKIDPSLTSIKLEGVDSIKAEPILTGVKQEGTTDVKTEVKGESSSSDEEESDSNLFDSDFDDANEDEDGAKFKLRDYQLELAEKANAGINTVVCAPTGVGKTWVALHIIHKHLQQRKDEGKVMFMAKTGALIKQQADRIKKYLPQYETKLLQGDAENSQMLGEYLRDYDIFCFTPQILVNNLESGSVKSLTDISLIILDECHHTRGDSPYSNLMRRYLMEKFDRTRDNKLPQIVGLTATLGVGKSSTDTDALDYIVKICSLLDVTELSTAKKHKEAMDKKNSTPDEEIIKMQMKDYDPARNILRYAIQETEAMLEELALMQPDLIELMHEKCPPTKESPEYNQWTHNMMKAAQSSVDDYDTSRNIYSCANYLNVYNQALEVNGLLHTQDVITFLAQKHQAEAQQKHKLTDIEHQLFKNLIQVQTKLNKDAKNQKNPNLQVVSSKLRSMLESGGDEPRAMVFVEARATCKALTKFLAKELQDIVRTSALYGKDQRGNDEGMTQAVQDDTVQKFREGYYKVIVATSIGAEGIDIPDCNMALSYNYIGNEISKVQRRGRIRKHGGKNITMLKEEDLEKERLSAYKEAMMLRAMKQFDNLRIADIERKVNLYQKEEMQKYRFKYEVEAAKKRRKTDEGDYEIRCQICNTLACYISDIRTIKVQHIVIDNTFAERIDIRRHKNPKVFDGFDKNRKMRCKICPQDWGVVAEKSGLDCRILRLASFKLVNMETRVVKQYKKWIDVPYKIPEIDVDDLKRLLGEATD